MCDPLPYIPQSKKSAEQLSHTLVLSRFTFATGSPDNIKQWKFPDGNFLQNLTGHQAIINSIAVNSDGVLVSGGMFTKL